MSARQVRRSRLAYSAVHIENAVTIVNRNRRVPHEPRSETRGPAIERPDIPAEEQHKLDQVRAKEGVPQPATGGRFGLWRQELSIDDAISQI